MSDNRVSEHRQPRPATSIAVTGPSVRATSERRGPNATPVSENVTRLAYTQCRDGVSVELHGPGLVTREIDASRPVWDFLERYRVRH